MARIKITDSRHTRTFRTGINGRYFEIPVNREIEVEDGMVDHLEGLGVAFDEVSSKGASGSKEGSVEKLAPMGVGNNSVIAPANDPRTVDEAAAGRVLPGDQPGDAIAAGDGGMTAEAAENIIAEDARISDIRVAAERQTKKDAPAAEKAGEGEGGTEKATVPTATTAKTASKKTPTKK